MPLVIFNKKELTNTRPAKQLYRKINSPDIDH